MNGPCLSFIYAIELLITTLKFDPSRLYKRNKIVKALGNKNIIKIAPVKKKLQLRNKPFKILIH